MISLVFYVIGVFVGFILGFLHHHFTAKVDYQRFELGQWQYINDFRSLWDWLFLDVDLRVELPRSWGMRRGRRRVLFCRTLIMNHTGQLQELFPKNIIMSRKDGTTYSYK